MNQNIFTSSALTFLQNNTQMNAQQILIYQQAGFFSFLSQRFSPWKQMFRNWNCFLHSFPHHLWLYFLGLAQVLHRLGGLSCVGPSTSTSFQSSHCLSLPYRQILPYITPGYVSGASPSSKGSKRAGIEFQGAHIPQSTELSPVHRKCSFMALSKSANSLFFN